jgi:hypothetical protein
MWNIEDIYDYLPRVSEDTYEDSGSYNVVEYWDKYDMMEDIYQEDLKYERTN